MNLDFKYQPGDRVGPHGVVLLCRLGKDHRGKWLGTFRCHCGKEFQTLISSVQQGLTQSCGCVALANSRKALAMIPTSVLHENGRKYGRLGGLLTGVTNFAKVPQSIRAAHSRTNLANIPRSVLRKAAQLGGRLTGAANTLALCKSKRDYWGTIFRSSWEVVVAASLRKAGITYEHEPICELNACSYRPDFWLPSLDLYLEVKGRQFETGMSKFREFAKSHQAILLDKQAVKFLVGTTNPARLTNVEIDARVRPFTDYLEGRCQCA